MTVVIDRRGSERRHHVRPLTPDERDAIAGWRYPGRYATYDYEGGPPTDEDEVFAVVDADDRMVGYCCFGPLARIPEVGEAAGIVDVGYGMQPELMGQGRGRDYLAAILAFARERYRPDGFRALVLDWNERSLATCRGAGFAVTGAVRGEEGDFVVMERGADGPDD
jgi:ribosomal-protein-alanine N-acetyltransferase